MSVPHFTSVVARWLSDQRQHGLHSEAERHESYTESLVAGTQAMLVTSIPDRACKETVVKEEQHATCARLGIRNRQSGRAAPVWVLNDVAEIAGDHEVDVQGVDQFSASQQHRHVAHCINRVRNQHLQASTQIISTLLNPGFGPACAA